MTAQSTGGPAKRVRVIAASDLRQNGGGYVLEGRIPLAVYGVSEGETVAQGGQFHVEGNIPAAVYIVEAPDGVVTGNVPVPMIAVEGGLVAGNTAIPVYVVGGSLGGLDPVTNLALAIGNAPANDEIVATWDAVSGATGYEIEYSDDGVAWTPVDTTAGTSYALTSADYDPDAVTHYVRVRAVNGGGESEWEQATIEGWKLNVTFYANLDEVSGNRATVVSGMTLTDNNTVGSVPGKVSLAANFVAANNEYLNGGDSTAVEIGAGDFTIAAWVRNISGGGSYQVALGKDDFPSSPREWAVFARFADLNELRLLLFDAGDNVVGDVATASLSLDTWYHVVFTRSGSTLLVYLNAGTPVTASTTGTPRSSSSASFTISAPSGAGNYNGYIDEVAIAVGRAWSAGQIADNYNAGNGTTY